MVTRLVAAGLGMSYLPDFVTAKQPALQRVPGTVSAPDRSIWLLLHTDMRETTRIRLFVDFLAPKLRALRPVLDQLSLNET